MPTSLTLTTWNVQNLFKPDPNEDDFAEKLAQYDAKIPLLANTIRELDPDVIGLQEVGGDDALADLQTALGGAYLHRHYGVPDERGIACAVLSKHPFQSAKDIEAVPPALLALKVTEIDGAPLDEMGRGAVHVRVAKEDFTTDVIVVHLKSKLLTFPNGEFSTNDETLRAQVASLAIMRRTIEAATVRIAATTVLEDNAANALVVMGDFNDAPEAASTQLLQGPDGSEIGTRGFDMPDGGDDVRLWNLAERIDEERRFSRVHKGQGELLDQIFVSEEYFPRGSDGLRRLPVSVDSLIENLRSIGDNPNAENGKLRPDHAPVTATFEFD